MTNVSGGKYRQLLGMVLEIARQIGQKGGYPHDQVRLKEHLQLAIKGEFAPSFVGGLKFIKRHEVSIKEPVSSREFFTRYKGFTVEGLFEELFLSDEVPSPLPTTIKIVKYSPNDISCTGEHVLAEFNHTREARCFESEEFCQLLAHLITTQTVGDKGVLLDNQWLNGFFVKDRKEGKTWVVDVMGNHGYRRWEVRIQELEEKDHFCSLDWVIVKEPTKPDEDTQR